jgi:hypothetical protein
LYIAADMRWSGVCERHGLMCRGRECARLGSATRLVSFYVSLVGGGLRPSRPWGGVDVDRRTVAGVVR